ncbi:MAG: hypothetical protein KKB93_14585, partial [Actinobacteria bacterium]|nr:hypothetical protein [Actinomycetota bacterium]
MTIAYTLPASIEAEKAMAKARKVNPFRPLFNSTLACMTFPFKLDRNCEIHIKEELMPKKAIIDVSSLLNENDGLKGFIISGYSKKPFPSP